MDFLALRLCLFSCIRRYTVSVSELFSGAEFSTNFSQLRVNIPDSETITVHHLLDAFPGHRTVRDLDGETHDQPHKSFHKLFVNGRNAPVDGFMQLQIADGGSSLHYLSVSLQMKLAEVFDSKQPGILNKDTLDKELGNFSRISHQLKQENNELECIFGVFSNRQRSRDLVLSSSVRHVTLDKNKAKKKGKNTKPIATVHHTELKTFLIHSGNFNSYYGYTFSGRAQFSATAHLCINSAPEFHFKYIRGIGDKTAKKIDEERKKRRFADAADVKRRIPHFPSEALRSIVC